MPISLNSLTAKRFTGTISHNQTTLQAVIGSDKPSLQRTRDGESLVIRALSEHRWPTSSISLTPELIKG